jgi:hypothetical protein
MVQRPERKKEMERAERKRGIRRAIGDIPLLGSGCAPVLALVAIPVIWVLK